MASDTWQWTSPACPSARSALSRRKLAPAWRLSGWLWAQFSCRKLDLGTGTRFENETLLPRNVRTWGALMAQKNWAFSLDKLKRAKALEWRLFFVSYPPKRWIKCFLLKTFIVFRRFDALTGWFNVAFATARLSAFKKVMTLWNSFTRLSRYRPRCFLPSLARELVPYGQQKQNHYRTQQYNTLIRQLMFGSIL